MKAVLVHVFILVMLGTTYRMAQLTMASNHDTLSWIESREAGEGNVNEMRYFNSYSKTYIDGLKRRINSENNVISKLIVPLLLAGLVVWLVLICVVRKPRFKLQKNDGIALLVFTFSLAISLLSLYSIICTYFQDASAATNGFQTYMHGGLIICLPIMFLATSITNQKECSIGLQSNRWVTKIAIVLFVITALFALFIWFAISAFDFAGNWG